MKMKSGKTAGALLGADDNIFLLTLYDPVLHLEWHFKVNIIFRNYFDIYLPTASTAMSGQRSGAPAKEVQTCFSTERSPSAGGLCNKDAKPTGFNI